MNKNRTIFWHIAGCIVFLSLPALLSPHPPEEVNFLTSRPAIRDLLANALMLIFFYCNYYLLIPRLYFKKKVIIYAACISLAFVTVCILPPILTGNNPFNAQISMPSHQVGPIPPPKPEGSTFLQEIKHLIYLFSSVTLFTILLKIRHRLLKAEQMHHEAIVVSLKEQINPHFLFNTLNGLYALAVRDKSTTTASGILKLSGIMRYVVTETSNGPIPLQKEIAYVHDYIELQKLRLDKGVNLSFQVNGTADGWSIAPLVLMPFIENAFKHGVNPDEECNINILIEIGKSALKLTVENNKVQIALQQHEKSGKGIGNAKARLALLYPSRHSLILNEDSKYFRVQLIIQRT